MRRFLNGVARLGGIARRWRQRAARTSWHPSNRRTNARRCGVEQLESRCLLSILGPLPEASIYDHAYIRFDPQTGLMVWQPSDGGDSTVTLPADGAATTATAVAAVSVDLVNPDVREVQQAIEARAAAGGEHFADLSTWSVPVDDAGAMYLLVTVNAFRPNLASDLQGAGMSIVGSIELLEAASAQLGYNQVGGWIPYTSLESVAAVPGVGNIMGAGSPIFNIGGAVTPGSEGEHSIISAELLGLRSRIIAEVAANPGEDLRVLGLGLARLDADGRIELYARVATVDDAQIQQLQAAGLDVEGSNPDTSVVYGWISYASLDQLASATGVSTIDAIHFGAPQLPMVDSGPGTPYPPPPPSDHTHDADPPPPPVDTPLPLIATQLSDLCEKIEGAIAADPTTDLNTLSTFWTHVDSVGRIEVYVRLDAVTNTALQQLQSAGLVLNFDSDSEGTTGWISYAAMGQLAAVPGVLGVGTPAYGMTNAGAALTAGDGIHNADDVRALFAGVDGTEIKGGAVAASADAPTLTTAELQPMVTAALARWAAAGASAQVLAAMRQAQFLVTDLSGAYLGMAEPSQVYLDRDAAGYGWFVDSTPATDEEFVVQHGEDQLLAIDPQAVDRIDLLTVVEHELGHIAGLDDLDGTTADLMSGVLETGVRRGLRHSDLDAVFASVGTWDWRPLCA